MTATSALLFAMLAQAGLVLVLYLRLLLQRAPLYMRSKVRMRDVALSADGWPDAVRKTSNAVDNQFQLPLLFYLCCALALYLGAGWLEVALAWMFFVSRCVHAVIHVTSNYVPNRFFAFLAGFVIVAIFWGTLLFRVASSAGL